MKIQTALLLVISVIITSTGSAQSEFTVHTNGLIYSDTTITQLRHIIDSLQLKFKVCERRTDYRSLPQGFAHYIYLDNGDIKQAKKDMINNIPLDDFVKKYPDCKIERNYIVGGFTDETKGTTKFIHFEVGKENRKTVMANAISDTKNACWAYEYYGNSVDDNENIRAFYFPSGIESKILPERYAALVQYVDCMVDTNASVLLPSAREETFKKSKNMEAFDTYILKAVGKEPKYNERDKNYDEKYDRWSSRKDSFIRSTLSATPEFKKLLIDAIQEAKINGGSTDEFEEYVKIYYSPSEALQLKRSRHVVGGCSMDTRPRNHALEIAQLSAQTIQWDIFLRAHLDIMNDNFSRMSDGSYAWKRRQTYIKELEVLGINLPDLLLGITLRIDNPSTNHYYGNIARTGRALSETNVPAEMEKRMLASIGDSSLDFVNRMLVYYLYSSYNAYLEVGERRKNNIENLDRTLESFPFDMRKKIMESERESLEHAEKKQKEKQQKQSASL